MPSSAQDVENPPYHTCGCRYGSSVPCASFHNVGSSRILGDHGEPRTGASDSDADKEDAEDNDNEEVPDEAPDERRLRRSSGVSSSLTSCGM